MDNTDQKILQILQKKARIPNVDVARKIKMAPSAVLGRIKKLEDRGIIDGYEVRLNPNHFNQSMVAFIQITLKDITIIEDTCKTITDIKQVQEVHHLAGQDCIMVKLRAAEPAALEKILRQKFNPIENILNTKTLIALATYKESAQIVIPEQTGDN
ncbi:MAG: Lrp/AsnC family transcriptional regulator [Desulfobacteraceae bacterium]|nr:Lrp/AsnC family transcriptional regulator [Desulfobacteraceae bacterium]